MEIKLPEELAKKIGAKALRAYGIEDKTFAWKKWVPIDLSRLTRREVETLRDLAKPHEKVRGTGVLLHDLGTWLRVLDDDTTARARTVTSAASLMRELLRRALGHRVFERSDESSDAMVCYYAGKVYYQAKERHHYSTTPEHVVLVLFHEKFGGRAKTSVRFFEEDCRGITPTEALARAGYYVETEELRAAYLAETARFASLVQSVGLQCLAVGIGTDDLDGNGKGDSSSWWRSRTNRIQLDPGGAPSRVVVDVFREDGKEKDDRNERENPERFFWGSAPGRDGDDEEDESLPKEDAEVAEPEEIEVPIHPFVAVFDLARHLRLQVHVSNLTPYTYDRNLHTRLVLPADVKSLVAMLLGARGGFSDIVSGKSGGAIVACVGRPGTGKTLTAQVYAETMGRPLYSVQAAQLGLSAEELEDELLKVFARANRWGAILLIDEADVYVRERGDDIAQNAIVGVFLRVLEHYSGVLFLTSNRAATIDDAIASRCLARIDYEVPTEEEQARIWRILADGAGISLSPEVVAAVVEKFPHLSGRDVKNLLKLAHLVATATEQPITLETIAYVKRFKPTSGEDEEGLPRSERAPPPKGLLAFAEAPRGRARKGAAGA